ncbi:EF-hand domain-containing protein [Cereibacter sphaeroides]|uniref:EF-hand domain-containing protein n=1 Tax=Cereibacter sphaeroides TaxID=1063 RepID=A0AAX1UJA4_CERSP|nr:EF-hand domain-containing protein [Cereibacter sphaeroides]RHZ93870.1 EF-hand domain-containing protein [Cereibacter sphaeroides]
MTVIALSGTARSSAVIAALRQALPWQPGPAGGGTAPPAPAIPPPDPVRGTPLRTDGRSLFLALVEAGDTDGDGSLSAAELDALLTMESGGEAEDAPSSNPLVALADQDGDGVISADEMIAAQAAAAPPPPPPAKTGGLAVLIARADKDGDGALSSAEIEAAQIGPMPQKAEEAADRQAETVAAAAPDPATNDRQAERAVAMEIFRQLLLDSFARPGKAPDEREDATRTRRFLERLRELA